MNTSLQYLGIGFSFLYGVVLFDDRTAWVAVVGMSLIVAACVRATVLRTSTGPALDRPMAKS